MESYDREDELGEELDNKRQKERANLMRAKIGVIGKIYNLIVYIRALPNYINKFKALFGKLIPLGNRMRWNSWFRMLYVTLKTEVLNALRNYTEAHINKGIINKRDKLTSSNVTLYCIIK